jgi:hypothetical protein
MLRCSSPSTPGMSATTSSCASSNTSMPGSSGHGRLIGNFDDATMDGRMECTNYDVDIPGVVADPANIGTPGVDAEQDNTEPDDPCIQVLDEAHDEEGDIRGVDGELHLSITPSQAETTPPILLRRSTRPTTQPSSYIPSMTGSKYSYAVTQLGNNGVLHPDAHMFLQKDFYQAEPDVATAVMTQLSLKNGLKAWRDKACEAAVAKMSILHFRNTFEPLHWRQLSDTQRKTVLESHMFLKEKRDGKIKGRTVAGGNKQRDYIPKEDASSPTVAIESASLSCIIDTEAEREVALIDIRNASIQTEVEEVRDMAIIKLRRYLADIVVKIAPDVYNAYAATDKKKLNNWW